MSFPRRDFPRLAAQALAIFTAWTVAGLFFGSQYDLITRTRGFEQQFQERLYSLFIGTTFWALFTPPIVFVAERLPLKPPHTLRNALMLLPFAALVALARSPFDVFAPWYTFNAPHPPKGDDINHYLALFQIHFLFVIVIIGLTNIIRLERETAARRDAEPRFHAAIAQARLRRLRADLDPHFLFNSLNAAAALVHTDPAAAERTVDALSDLLQRSMRWRDATEVRLRDELEFVDRYFDLQRTRFGARLRSEVHVASEELLDAAIPPLLIQPLVENAIVHSVATRAAGGSVRVDVKRDGRWLNVEVCDDGKGFDPTAAPSHGSIGIPNARLRLEHLYGAQQSLTFERRHDEFIARVRLPLHNLEAA